MQVPLSFDFTGSNDSKEARLAGNNSKYCADGQMLQDTVVVVFCETEVKAKQARSLSSLRLARGRMDLPYLHS